MNKFFTYGLLGCMLGLCSVPALAQDQKTVERGGELTLTAADGYTSYQWQVSSDKLNFVDVDGADAKTLSLSVYAPAYYRLKATSKENVTVYADTVQVNLAEVKYAGNPTVSGGGHGYVESLDGKPGATGISLPEDRVNGLAGTTKKLTDWKKGDVMAVYYIHHPKGVMDTEMDLTITRNSNVSFRVTVWDPEDMSKPMAQSIVALKGTGKEQAVKMIGLDIPVSKYYRYQIECLEGWQSIREIARFNHYSTSSIASYKAAYLSSPSVHLSNWSSTKPGTSTDAVYDWCYQEVMLPAEYDIPGTYVMSLGVLDGYMGIQMNGWNGKEPKHDVIFSMWDHGNVDDNPDLPDHLRAKELDFNPGVKIERFRGEGTGVKSFFPGNNWKCDTFVQFITNSRLETKTYTITENGKQKTFTQKNTLVSTWFNAQDGKGWQYMSTLRLPNQVKYFKSWYSFLENYNYPTGQAMRKGFYRNGYARNKNTKKWVHYNKVGFGHTDGNGKVGSRDDYGQGKTDEFEGTFFMTTGGYTPAKVTGQVVPLNTDNTPVDTIDLKAFEARIEQAIAREKAEEDMIQNFEKNKLDKKGWRVIKFSSQETSGEGSNGRASQIIDGNVNTYWHSRWTSGNAQCPHFFVIDMKELYDVTGMQITMSGGSDRYIKAFNLYVSEDNKTWKKVYTDDDAPNEETFQFLLNVPEKARYLKLEVTVPRCPNGPFVRINEIEVTGSVHTGIQAVQAPDNQFEISNALSEINLKANENVANAQVTLYGANGARMYSQSFASLAEGEVVNIPMMSVQKGVYVLVVNSDAGQFTKQIVWND